MRKIFIFMSLVMALFLISCAPKLTEEEALAELDGLSAEELNAVMAEDSGAVTGQGYNSPKLNTLKDYFTWLSCTDSDGGVDAAVEGKLTATYDSNGVKGTTTYLDSCLTADDLKEYYCVENKFAYQAVKCPNGCKSGVCIVCGDGVVQAGEQCDDGNAVSSDGCSATCQTEQVQQNLCGNSVLEVGEQCDDGNIKDNDGCSSTCQTENVVNVSNN